ncbi:MAG: pyridoxal-dependent decarboxylase, exosortase A system-associated [Rhodocyclaceae bacterium]|nr:pyridoxal-dependent decarboxylase, exosortase A system-associated [Rhodocyclaceae bacterium]
MSHSPKPPLTQAQLPPFTATDGLLLVAGVPLPQLAARVGQTPFYAYNRQQILTRIAELRAALPAEIKLHYAMKANPLPALVGAIQGRVDGIDIASTGELKIALDAGAPAHGISFAGPGKTHSELRQAVAAGILVNVESFREVGELSALSSTLKLPARVAVRINPDFELKGSGMKMGGGAKPFGVDAEQVPALLTAIKNAGLAFEGFQIFAGSQNLKAEAICEAQQRAYELALRLAKNAPGPVISLNLGGGFGIPYFPGEQTLDLSVISENLKNLATSARHEMPEASLIIELGRYLVGEAGIYVTRVVDRKISRGKTFLIVDGGLNHHLAATGNLGQVIRKNYPLAIGNKMNQAATEIVSIAGPLCTPLDLLADNVPLPIAQPGDFVVIFQSGAYGASASPQGFLGHPAVIEVLV